MIQKLRNATDSLLEVAIYYVLLLLVSSTVFSYAEGRSWAESMYWASVTSTTIGYGDISPATFVGRITALVTALLSVFLIVPLIVVRSVEVLNVDRDALTHDEQEEMKRELREIKDALEKLTHKLGN